jgi:hypothetical protein
VRWPTKPKPRYGDRRTRVRFALLPVRCDGGMTVWLERYVVDEEHMDGDAWDPPHWRCVRRFPMPKAAEGA